MISVHTFLKVLIGIVCFGLCCQTFAQLDFELAKKKCAELGFKTGTERFGSCVLQLSKPDEAKAVTNTRPSEPVAQPINTLVETQPTVVAPQQSPRIDYSPPVAQKVIASPDQNYNSSCSACHNTGVAGAPKLGDKNAWAQRLRGGMDALYKSTLNGKPGTAMMAKGGAASLSDTEAKAIVDWMIDRAR